jgi:lipid-A-disaccharide synthase
MTEDLRVSLYLLGFLASLAFSSRVILQWVVSEAQGKSVVNRLFWQLSIVGASIMIVHSLIQLQYNVGLVQTINCVIYCRNLNLMQKQSDQYRFSTVFVFFLLGITALTLCFVLQGWYYNDGTIIWSRIPTYFSNSTPDISSAWHLFGLGGMILFAGRFWVQWWDAEKNHESVLNPSFWWISLVGAIISVVYFAHLRDIANLIGPATGLIPYVRNLMLIRKNRIRTTTSSVNT